MTGTAPSLIATSRSGAANSTTSSRTYQAAADQQTGRISGPLCKSHHRLKHEAGWKKTRDQQSGQTIWTSLLGKHYFVEPVKLHANPDIDYMDGPDDPPLPESIQQKLDAEALSYCRPKSEVSQMDEVCPF